MNELKDNIPVVDTVFPSKIMFYGNGECFKKINNGFFLDERSSPPFRCEGFPRWRVCKGLFNCCVSVQNVAYPAHGTKQFGQTFYLPE